MAEVEKGIGKIKVGLIICVILVVILAISNVWFYTITDSLQNQVDNLETDKDNLQSQINTLQTDKSTLEGQVDNLETEKNQLQTWLDGNKTLLQTIIDERDELEEWLNGNITDYESQIESLNSQIATLNSQINSLNTQITSLQSQIDSLIPVTYYTVDERLNITNLKIVEEYWITYVRGNVTNIGDEPIENVYVYIIVRNPDGTADYSPYDYDKLENLYIGETMEFEISVYLDEGQTFEVLLIY